MKGQEKYVVPGENEGTGIKREVGTMSDSHGAISPRI